MKFDTGHEKEMLLLLYDLRSITFGSLGYTEDQKAERDRAWESLPSQQINKRENQKPLKIKRKGGIRKANAAERNTQQKIEKELKEGKIKIPPKYRKTGK